MLRTFGLFCYHSGVFDQFRISRLFPHSSIFAFRLLTSLLPLLRPSLPLPRPPPLPRLRPRALVLADAALVADRRALRSVAGRFVLDEDDVVEGRGGRRGRGRGGGRGRGARGGGQKRDGRTRRAEDARIE